MSQRLLFQLKIKVMINDEEFSTVYTKDGNNITIVGNIITGSIEIEGLNLSGITSIDKWFIDATQKDKLTSENNKIGAKEAIYFEAPASVIYGKVTAGVGLEIFIDGLSIDNFHDSHGYYMPVGTHKVTINAYSGYDDSDAYIEFNGQKVTNGQVIITADMESFVLTATGAVPAQSSGSSGSSSSDDGMSITDILLIVLVVLIVIMAILVAIRMMRS